MSARVLMLVMSDVAGDARVLREATTLAEHGYRVHVIGRDVPEDFTPPDGVTVSSATARSVFRRGGSRQQPAGARPLPPHLRVARWLLLPRHRASAVADWTARARRDARTREFDVVHTHDLGTLGLAAELAAARGARLVYDAHELWWGRPRVGRPTPLRTRSDVRRERRLGAHADAVLTVGEGVADRLRERHGFGHVSVVRNSFPLATPPGEDEQAGPPTGLVYAGRIAPYRELETVVAAARFLDGLTVTVVGPADETYLAGLDRGPVTVLAPLAYPELEALMRRAGIVLVTHSSRWENHRLALPNKLFHAVRVGVPVVATDVPELRRVVGGYGIGTLYRPGDAGSLAGAAREARDRYAELVAAVRLAAPALSWEHDEKVLLDVYRGLP